MPSPAIKKSVHRKHTMYALFFPEPPKGRCHLSVTGGSGEAGVEAKGQAIFSPMQEFKRKQAAAAVPAICQI